MTIGRTAYAALLILLAAAPAASAYRGEGKPILGIAVYGDYGVERGLIEREFGLAVGDTCSLEAVGAGLARIERLAGVRSATHKLNVDGRGNGVFILLIITEEEKTWSARPLIRRDFTDKISFGAELRETDLRGRNETLYISASVRGAVMLEAGWASPRAFGTDRISTGLRAAYRGYRWPYPSFERLLVDDRIDWFEGYIYLGLGIADGLSLFIEPGLEIVRAGDPMLEGQGEGGVPGAPSGTLSAIKAGIRIERLDREFYPEKGVRLEASVKRWGALQSDPAFETSRVLVDGALFADLGRPLLSVCARGVLNEAGIPAYLYEHLGGMTTIRGYEFGIFCGENSALVRTDLRVPLNFRDLSEMGNPVVLVDMSVFVDTGAAWCDGEDLSSHTFHSGCGLAMSFIVKEGWLLKLGYAWPMDKDGRWFFDIGTMF